jgi:hypothetical protein
MDEYQEALVLRYWAFDWDDNIVHMSTKINMDEKVGENQWSPIQVSTSDFAHLRNDPNYRIRNNSIQEAFSEFRDNGARGNRAFMEDALSAIQNEMLAPSWDDFLECLSEGAIFSIITARGHEPETIKKVVLWIIDNVLTQTPSMNPGRSLADDMYQNLRKYLHWFDKSGDESKELSGPPSENPLVQNYLSHCDFFGVSSQSFAKRFGSASADKPEEAKMMALEYCIDRCLNFARLLEEKSGKSVRVKFGMSDDDPKTSSHIKKFFKEKSGLSHMMDLYYFQTTERGKKGGEKTKYPPLNSQSIQDEGEMKIEESSHRAPGMDSSVLPFTQFNNMTKTLYPSTKDQPKDDAHNMRVNQLGQLGDLYKKFGYKRKKNKFKK